MTPNYQIGEFIMRIINAVIADAVAILGLFLLITYVAYQANII